PHLSIALLPRTAPWQSISFHSNPSLLTLSSPPSLSLLPLCSPPSLSLIPLSLLLSFLLLPCLASCFFSPFCPFALRPSPVVYFSSLSSPPLFSSSPLPLPPHPNT